MKKFAVSIARSGVQHAGGKARFDLIDFLLDDGWTEFSIQGGHGKVGKVLYRLKTLWTLMVLPRSSIFCTQFPINTAYARLAMRVMIWALPDDCNHSRYPQLQRRQRVRKGRNPQGFHHLHRYWHAEPDRTEGHSFPTRRQFVGHRLQPYGVV
jgi:hypothetical protein